MLKSSCFAGKASTLSPVSPVGPRNFFPAAGFNPMTALSVSRLIRVNREQDFRRRRNTTMNRPKFKRFFPQALAWAGLVALCSALALAQGTTAPPSAAAAVRTDGQIEMDVVHALDTSTVLKDDLITAATIQSEVTLSGTVSSASSRELAESVPRHVPGVTKVNNNLKVGNPNNPPPAQNEAGSGESKSADSQPGNGEAPYPADAPAEASDAQAQLRAQIRAEIRAQMAAQRQARAQDPSSPAPPPPPVYEAPKGPVTIPQG